MHYRYLTLTLQDQVATLSLNRPEVHNAFDDMMIAELIAALDYLSQNNQVRIVVLRGVGKSFSAGADLNWMQRMVQYTYEENLQDAQKLADLMHHLYHLNKPTIAVVQGAAYGGAVGLISCCDIAIGTEHANFCLSETRIGLIPAVISPYVINAIGERAAHRYYLTAERFDIVEATRLGLIHIACSETDLPTQLEQLCLTLLKNSPAALSAAKNLIIATSRGEINTAMREDTAHRIAVMRISEEGQEGIQAFLTKRQPAWQLKTHK